MGTGGLVVAAEVVVVLSAAVVVALLNRRRASTTRAQGSPNLNDGRKGSVAVGSFHPGAQRTVGTQEGEHHGREEMKLLL